MLDGPGHIYKCKVGLPLGIHLYQVVERGEFDVSSYLHCLHPPYAFCEHWPIHVYAFILLPSREFWALRPGPLGELRLRARLPIMSLEY